ncbi:MAG: phosphate uptake regulator PhoU [Nitrososphaerales archaeon]|nr:phosphate uptake regulator PhoU [Nitrososphaerales archaeon]
MELRKAQEMGGGTILISLPKEWVERYGLKKGSIIAIDTTIDGGLLLHPFRGEEKRSYEINIPYLAEDLERLVDKITGAYLLGYDVIKIFGNKRIDYKDREGIKKGVRRLIGLEIVEEDAHSITLQFLPEPTTLNPTKMFMRMHMLVMGMIKDAITSLIENDEHLAKVIIERDDEVDRIYFLLVRMLRSAVLNQRLANTYGLSAVDCLDYRVAATILEAAGDAAVELVQNLHAISKDLSKELSDRLLKVRTFLEESQKLTVKAFLSKDEKDLKRVEEANHNLYEVLTNLKAEFLQKPLPSLLTVISNLDKMYRCYVDISDLTVPIHPI